MDRVCTFCTICQITFLLGSPWKSNAVLKNPWKARKSVQFFVWILFEMTPARLKPFIRLFLYLQILEEDSAGLDAVLRTHLSSAAGYYYHLLTHLQLFYHLTLDSALSWGFPSSQKGRVSIFVFNAVSWGADCYLTHLLLGISLKNTFEASQAILWSLSGYKELKLTTKRFAGRTLHDGWK